MKEPFTKWQAWCDLILSAYFAPSEFFVRGIKVKAKRGCVYNGAIGLAEKWKWSRGKAERFLKYLVEDKRISLQKSNVITCITILNYEKFQQNESTNEHPNELTNEQSNGQLIKRVKKNNIFSSESQNSDIGGDSPQSDMIQQILEQMADLKHRLDEQEKKTEEKPKKKKEPNPLITKGREIFEKRYFDMYNDSYYWQAKDAVAMDSLIKKIIYARKQRNMSIEQDEVLEGLRILLISVQDQWLIKNFSVTNINSKYNEIVAQAKGAIKNGKDKQGCTDKRRSSEVTATGAKDYEGSF